MQRYTISLFLQIAVHVSGGSSAQHQEFKLYLQRMKENQLDAIVVYIYCSCRGWSTGFGRVRPSSGALEN
jgi:hypothetical protein